MTSSVAAGDVARVDALLAQFETNAGGSHLAMCEAAGAIARAGGPGGPEVVLGATKNGRGIDDTTRKPWQWLLAVAEATGHQDWKLVARIAWFAEVWTEHLLPTMVRGEALDTGLGEAPDDIRAELSALALTALSRVDEKEVVTRDATGTAATAGVVAKVCAQELARAAERGVPVFEAALALARREKGDAASGSISDNVADVPQPVPAVRVRVGPPPAEPEAAMGEPTAGKGTFSSLGVLFAKDSSAADRTRAVKDFAEAARARLPAAASAAEQGRDVLAERSAQILSELAGRLPIRTADSLRGLYGDDPEVQSQHVINEAGGLAGLAWAAAAALPGPPPVVQAIKVVVHSAIEIKMIGELYAIHADRANRDATWLGVVLVSWAIGQPVTPGGSVASTTPLLVAKIRSSVTELIGSQSRGAVFASRGREGRDVMVRAGARMQRRMRLHPSSWAQPGDQSAGGVLREATVKLVADKLAGRVPGALVSAARDRLAPTTPPVPGQPEASADPREALAWAWALHRQAAEAASAVSSSDLIAPRLTAALAAQERHLQDLELRLGKLGRSVPAQRDDGAGSSDAGYLVWQAEGAIDVVEATGARSRRLPSWSSRRRAALVYVITALVVSVLPAVGLVGSSGFGTLAFVATQCIALPWLSLAVSAIAIGALFRPWLGRPVPRHPVIGTWIVLAVHVGIGVAATVAGVLT